VNYSVTKAELKINKAQTIIKLKLTIDTRYGSVMDYFEIFLQRMILCRKAAERLGLQFKTDEGKQRPVPEQSPGAFCNGTSGSCVAYLCAAEY
jgi:hypothetical protein